MSVEALERLFAEGALDAANNEMQALSAAGHTLPGDIALKLRAQLRIVEAHSDDLRTVGVDGNGFKGHMVMTPDVPELYTGMKMQYRDTIEHKATVVQFGTEYVWEDLKLMLVSSKALALVFPNVLKKVTVVKEEGAGSVALHVELQASLMFSNLPYEGIFRIRELQYANADHGKATPVLLLQDVSEEEAYRHYRHRDTHKLLPRVSAVFFATQYIDGISVAMCTRRAVRGSMLRQSLAPWTSDIYVRYLLANAVQAWLETSAKVYHGDRSVCAIKAQLGVCSEFSDPFLTPVPVA